MTGGPHTLTFLFTDIEGSTRRWADDPEMGTKLAAHDELLRRAIVERRGTLFKHTGDGACAVFTSAVDAARAAVHVQSKVGLPIRIGLHTGEAEERDGDWFGATLNRAARIMDAGHGGQILCSTITAGLLPADVVTKSLGEYRLKGIERAETLVQIGRGTFDAPRAGSTMIQLPERGRSLLGRDDLLARIDAALDAHRIVTLTGPGGVGKTAVAVEAARRRTGLVDRTAFVDLTTVDDPDGVPLAVARALGLSAAELPAIRLAIGAGDTLLVMDNCEHVVDAAAEVVDNLVHVVGPGVRVLATSRESLEVDGESVIVIHPLADDEVMVELFIERAAAVGAAEPRPDDVPRIADLCRRLDGLPLAIELAAARCSVLSVEQIIAHLDQRMQLLSSARRRGRERHRTLRETIDWSYELLGDRERDAYRRLSVFVDWFGLDDAVAVCPGFHEMEVLDVLEGLVARSLLSVMEIGGTARYRYLESIRDHAWELLVSHGRADGLMNTVADHLARKLGCLADEVWGGPDGDQLEEMGRLLLHQRHLVEWCVSRGDVGRAKVLLLPYALVLPNGYPTAYDAAERLARVSSEAGIADAEVLGLQMMQRLFARQFREYRPAIVEIRALVDLRDLSPPLTMLMLFAAGVSGDAILEHELVAARPQVAAPIALHMRGLEHYLDGGLDDVLAVVRSMSTRSARAALMHMVLVLAATNEPERVPALADELLALAPSTSSGSLSALTQIAGAHVRGDELSEALECGARALSIAKALGEQSAIVPLIALHALVLQRLDRAEDAARVRGVAPRRWTIYFQAEREEIDAWLAARFTPDQLRAFAAEGRAMDLDTLFAIAPAALAESVSNPRAETGS